MHFHALLISVCVLATFSHATRSSPTQHRIAKPTTPEFSVRGVSSTFFLSLERLSRLVDIAYCIGTTGVTAPFSCVSRCADFPSLNLVSTWSTGVISLADSCGYIAVDHGLTDPKAGDIAHSPEIIVAFRGTYSIANTVIDLSTVPQEYVPYPSPDDGDDDNTIDENKCANCTVHMGFLTSWQSARTLVLPHLLAAKEAHPSYPIHLVGHSLGGAVAALAALELRLSHGWENITVTTFGEPRIGNRELASYLDRAFNLTQLDGYDPELETRPYRRVTHVNDPVPLLPLGEWGYVSHGGEVFIEKQELQPGIEDLRLCRGDEDPECSARSGGSVLKLRPWQLFFAHRDYFGGWGFVSLGAILGIGDGGGIIIVNPTKARMRSWWICEHQVLVVLEYSGVNRTGFWTGSSLSVVFRFGLRKRVWLGKGRSHGYLPRTKSNLAWLLDQCVHV